MDKLCKCRKEQLKKFMMNDIATPANSLSEDIQRMADSVERALNVPCTCKEPKPECDLVPGTCCSHIVEMYASDYTDPVLVMVDNTGKETITSENYFPKHCPECGEKLNHPSELMGKGFQVGDKVIVTSKGYYFGRTGVIEDHNHDKNIGCDVRMDDGELYWTWPFYLKPVLPVEEKKEVDQIGNKLKQPIELEEDLVENSVNVDFDSGKPIARVGYLNGKYISIGERDVESRSHICNCGFWDSEKKWGETVYTQQFGDRCISMSVTNNYVICSKCGQKLRRVAISYLDD